MAREARVTLRALLMLARSVVACRAEASTPLPYQSTNKHVGVATCATSVCHGSVTPSSAHDVRLDEFVTWSHEDKHSQAYAALSSEKGRAIAAKLGMADARTEKVCLDCHSDDVPAQQRGSGFTLSDGIGCEACHGGAGPWLTGHTARNSAYRTNVARGMYPTADLPERIELCLSCHYGNSDKFVTHRIMGAGHPRLSFELDTFLALEPVHYDVDADYQKRKPTYSRAQLWAYGQLAAARRQMQLLQGPLLRQASLVPELALLDCHACHENPLHRLDWSRGTLTRLTQPGSLTFPEGHLEMAVIVARRVSPVAAREILESSQMLQKAAGENRERVIATANRLAQALGRSLIAVQGHEWTRADVVRMLNDVVELGSAGEYRDYISAEQAVMAIDVLAMDAGLADRYRPARDALYGAVRDEDGYRPGQLRELLTQLHATLQQEIAQTGP